MKRGVFDILRRALDNTIANWQLILIRLGETILFIALAIGAALVIIVPVLVSVGIEVANLEDAADFENAMLALASRWMLAIWIILGVSILFLVFVAIHSFVQAGSARVYVDGDKIAGPALDGERARYGVFSMERWFAGGRDGWWTVFWIYNLAWGVFGAILLVPLVPTALLMVLFRETVPIALASGCLGLLVTLMIMLVGGILTGMWTNRAIADWAVRRGGVRQELAAGWAAIRGDFGRHVLIALAVIVVALAGSAFFATFSFFAGFAEGMGEGSGLVMLATLPIRLVASLLSSAFSAVVSAWYLAAYCTVATE